MAYIASQIKDYEHTLGKSLWHSGALSNTYHKHNQTLLEIREANREEIIHAYTTTQHLNIMG